MIPVVDHHAQDIVSLGALASRMTRMLCEPDCDDFADPSLQMGLARFFESAGERRQSEERLESTLQRLRDPVRIHAVSMKLAASYKRRGQYEEAVAVWEAQADCGLDGRIEPFVELAKHCEHRLKDLDQARKWTLRAIESLDFSVELKHYIPRAKSALSTESATVNPDETTPAALRHRLARLERRLERLRRLDEKGGAE